MELLKKIEIQTVINYWFYWHSCVKKYQSVKWEHDTVIVLLTIEKHKFNRIKPNMSGILNSTIVSSDRTQLLEDDRESRRRCNGCCCTHKRFLYVLFAFLIIAAGHALAIYFLYFRCTKENNCVPLKVRWNCMVGCTPVII